VADELTWLAAWQLRDLMATRQVSPVEVTEHFLARIEEHNPVLRALRHVDAAGARERAREAESQVLRGEDLGSLHGVPLAVKEHIAVAGMPVLVPGVGDKTARFDDLGVARLREAGAVIVGTNTMMGTQAPAPGEYNWAAEARSPWDTARVPGWSSSGGAASTAAGLLPLTIGSDGGGSTRLPAAYSGLVGVHPTAGLVPSFNYAVQRRADRTGTIGPLARSVVDAAIALGAMAGPDGRDFDCLQSTPPDYRAGLERGIDGLRLGWTDDFGYASKYAFGESSRVIAHVRDAAKGFAGLGATIEPLDTVWEDFYPGILHTMHLFSGVGRAERSEWTAAIDVRDRNWRRFRAAFADYDLLISPTSQLLAPSIEDWAARWAGNGPVPFPHGAFAPHYTSHTHMFNWLGFPAVSVPVGFVDGLPVGMQVVGWPGDDDKVLRAAHAFLDASPREEHPPGF
jgi:amidase/aspartyl-tRNA(Asn)/glutamyl-tRNA(Gln) amidotransferase subunit A